MWYRGEPTAEFAIFEGDAPEDPELINIDGARKAGRDGPKPGIVFPAQPIVGKTLWQEVAWTDRKTSARSSA